MDRRPGCSCCRRSWRRFQDDGCGKYVLVPNARDCKHALRVRGSPNASNNAASNVVIWAMRPSRTSMTSTLNARNSAPSPEIRGGGGEAVGPGSDQPPLSGSRRAGASAHQLEHLVAAAVELRRRRHRHPHILAQEGCGPRRIAALMDVDEHLEDLLLTWTQPRARRGGWHGILARRGHRGAGSLERAVGGAEAGLQQRRGLLR